MTHQQQAAELIERFLNQPINFPFIDSDNDHCVGSGYMTHKSAVKCALIAVELILSAIPNTVPADGYGSARFKNPDIDHWQSVKAELEKV